MPSSGELNTAYRDEYFTQYEDNANKWRCICGKEISQTDKKGYTNLISHLKALHPEYNKGESDTNQ